MRSMFAMLSLLASLAPVAAQQPTNGLTSVVSNHPAAATIDRLESAIKSKGMKIFTRIDHAAAAAEAGLSMPPATVVVFCNPAGGTPNFLRVPTLAIDLPLKALVWQDQGGKVFVTYNNGPYLIGTIFPRHGLTPPAEAATGQENLLADIVRTTTQ